MKTQRIKFTAASPVIFFFAAYIFLASVAFAQTTGFSFQGRLNDGSNPANGQYDLQFQLYDAIIGGNQIGSTVPRPNTTFINGVFSTTLDFGATAFSTHAIVFIEIAIRPIASPKGPPNAFTILGPRQQLTVVPLAVRAASAANADHADEASNAGFALSAGNASTLGNYPVSNFVRINADNKGNLRTSGDLTIGGNAVAFPDANGFVKAMIVVASSGQITRCYNGLANYVFPALAGPTTGNCGFAITMPLSGVYRIDFGEGFPITERFVSVVAQYVNSGLGGINNSGVNYREYNVAGGNTHTLEVFTFRAGDSADTEPRPFTIIVY